MLKKITLLSVALAVSTTTMHAQRRAPNARLQTYADALQAELNRNRTSLVEKYVSKTMQNQMYSEINQQKAITNTHYRSPQVHGLHDKKIPQQMLEIAKAQLCANDIDPSGITIVTKKQKTFSFFDTKVTLAVATAPCIKYVASRLQVVTPPKITLNVSELQKRTSDDVLFRIAHEVQHLVDHHGLERGIIEQYSNSKNFKNDKLYKAYRTTIEKCADLLPSVYDKTIAQATYNVFWNKCFLSLFKKRLPFGIYSAPETQKIAVKNILACH